MCSFIYPVVAHWVWHPNGWLRDNDTKTYIDFAGAGAVHLLGGASGFIGAVILGSRYDIFRNHENPLKESNSGVQYSLAEIANSNEKVEAIAESIFLKFDLNKNGMIERYELLKAMKEMHSQENLEETPEEDLSEIWEEIDLDKNGYLSFNDFKQLVKTVLELKVKLISDETGSASGVPDAISLMANSSNFDIANLYEVVGKAKGNDNKIQAML